MIMEFKNVRHIWFGWNTSYPYLTSKKHNKQSLIQSTASKKPSDRKGGLLSKNTYSTRKEEALDDGDIR